jgi:hypothetical protein
MCVCQELPHPSATRASLRSFWNLLQVQPGFNVKNVLLASLWMPAPNDPKSGPISANLRARHSSTKSYGARDRSRVLK